MKRPMKGYTTSHANKTKQAELATHNEEMGKISMDRRPRRAKSAGKKYATSCGTSCLCSEKISTLSTKILKCAFDLLKILGASLSWRWPSVWC